METENFIYNSLKDIVINFFTELSGDKIKDYHDNEELNNRISEFVKSRFDILTDENIDFEGLSNFIKNDALDEVKEWLFEKDIKRKEERKNTIIVRATEQYMSCNTPGKKDKDFIKNIMNDYMNLVHDCKYNLLPDEDKFIISDISSNVDTIITNNLDTREANKNKTISSRLDKIIIKAFDNEMKKNPSIRSIEINKSIIPKGKIDSFKFAVKSNDENFENVDITLQEIVKQTRECKKYTHILLYGIGGIGKTVALFDLNVEAYKVYIPLSHAHDGIMEYMSKVTFQSDKELYNEFLSICRDNNNPPIIILDGLNETTDSERYKLEQEINDELLQFNVQLIISSRYDATNKLTFDNMLRLSCVELSKSIITKYLNDLNLSIPEKTSRIWGIINTPFMLSLYVRTETEKKGDLAESKNAGTIIWKYIKSEIDRIDRINKNVGMAAVVFEYIAPYIAYKMINSYSEKYYISLRKDYLKILDEACSQFEKDANEHVLCGDLSYILSKNKFELKKDEIFDILTNQLCICSEIGDGIQFIHQHFRDSLAALYLFNQAEYNTEFIYEYLSNYKNEYIIDFLVDYFQFFDDEESQHTRWTNIWEDIRKSNRMNTCFIRKMLEVYKRAFNNDISMINFSEIDLSDVSLLGFKLSNSKEHFKNTKISRKTFCGDGHSMMVSSISWNSNSSAFVTSSHDMTIRIWDKGSFVSQDIGVSNINSHYIRDAKICPTNDKILAYGGDDRELRIIRDYSGNWKDSQVSKSKDWIYTIEWSTDGESIVYGDRSGNLNQYYINKDEQYIYTSHTKSIRHIDYSNNNMILSGGDDGKVCVWEKGIKTPLCVFLFDEKIIGAHWLDDTYHIAVILEKNVYFINISCFKGEININNSNNVNGIHKYETEVHIHASAFRTINKVNYYALFSDDSIYIKSVRLINDKYITTDIASRKLDNNQLGIISCAEWDDKCESIVFASRNGTIWLANLYLNEDVIDRIGIELVSRGYLNSARCSSWNNTGQFFATGYDDGTVRIRNTIDYHCINVLSGHRDSVKCIAWNPILDDELVSGSDDGTIIVWRLNEAPNIIHRGNSPVNCILWLGDKKIVAATDSAEFIFYNLDSLEKKVFRGNHTDRVYGLTKLPFEDGFLSAGDDKSLCLWVRDKNGDYSCIQTIDSGHKESIRCLANICKNSKVGIYSVGNDGAIIYHKYDRKNRKLLTCNEELSPKHEDFIYSVTIDEECKYIITGCTDASIGFWNVDDHKYLNRFNQHTSFVWHVATSPLINESFYMASSSSDGTVMIWNISDERFVEDLFSTPKYNNIHNNGILCFTPTIITILANVDVTGCDFSGVQLSDSGLKTLLQNEGGVF